MNKLVPYAIALAIGFGLGNISSCNSRYKLKSGKGIDYLCKKQTGQCEEITEDFQLGNLEYRLDGIKRQVLGLGLMENAGKYSRDR